MNFKKVLFRCKIKEGMFNNEYAIIGKNFWNKEFELFVDHKIADFKRKVICVLLSGIEENKAYILLPQYPLNFDMSRFQCVNINDIIFLEN